MKTICISILYFLCTLSYASGAPAQNSVDSKQEQEKLNKELRESNTQLDILCAVKIVKGLYFEQFAEAASAVREKYCDSPSSPSEVRIQIANALKVGFNEMTRLEGKKVLAGDQVFEAKVLYEYSSADDSLKSISSMSLGRDDNNIIDLSYSNLITIDEVKCNEILDDIKCMDYLEDFKKVYDFALDTLSKPLANIVVAHIDEVDKSWKDFYEKSRSQYPWEQWANYEFWNSSQQEGRFAKPPKWQLILLHPSLVIENVSSAVDGENTKEALMIEVLGFNYWQTDKWYQPSGLSLVSLYADRNQVKDWGWGAAVHFDNAFTIGYSKHDDENGIFISLDLWKLFEDKKSRYSNYRKKVNTEAFE